MRKKSQRSHGKFLVRGEGAGVLDEAAAERRARELAAIAGRARVRESDREEARAELLGQRLPATTGDDAVARRAVSRDPSDPPSRRGHQTRTAAKNGQQDVERLVLEGVEEAQHDQMVAARRRRRPLD